MREFRHLVLTILLLVLCIFLFACTTTPASQSIYTPEPSTSSTPTSSTVISEDFWQTFRCHFGFMPAFWDYENAREAGGAFDRPFFELFQWSNIEKTPGHFSFTETDSTVKEAQAYGMHILANIQPFAY